jgi:hypothetical protein
MTPCCLVGGTRYLYEYGCCVSVFHCSGRHAERAEVPSRSDHSPCPCLNAAVRAVTLKSRSAHTNTRIACKNV